MIPVAGKKFGMNEQNIEGRLSSIAEPLPYRSEF